ncbi:regenerating islet-derived protein 4-like [Ahaetulla prasina]|uniref:regenerating islet-derived protein 4-like n=1 Tax=Ahaetulla prasina TaxID=499056 RepID=UPI002647168A|nr:regenerating islet-derived protein 4-like [Ahaetulla prasina]
MGQSLEGVSCPLNWFLFEQHCYGFFQNKLTWNDAETECSSHGKHAHLASILSKREMETISSALLTKYEESFKIWIGLYKVPGGKTRFRWLDASLVDYIPWAQSQPSTYKGNCVELYGKDYKYWSLQFCCLKQPYLCKMALY